MNSDPTKAIPQDPQERIAHLEGTIRRVLTAESVVVGARFNLRRPGTENMFFKDLLLADGTTTRQGFRRILVTDREATDLNLHRQLVKARVPVLPLLPDVSDPELAFFGVGAGKRLLVHEKLHGRDSTGTYIGDKEIFGQLGELYGKTWRLTEGLLLEKDEPRDNPLCHVAVRSFSEKEGDILTLVPPYSILPAPDAIHARELFASTLNAALESKGDGIRTTQPLFEAAIGAFWQAQNQKS